MSHNGHKSEHNWKDETTKMKQVLIDTGGTVILIKDEALEDMAHNISKTKKYQGTL